MRKLLHISDVHFGPPHLPRLSAGVLELVERDHPDVVVLSGDLTQRAKPEQFRQAREFVDRLPVPALVVPGNHDVPLYRVWERAFQPFRAYRQHFDPELEPIYRDDELLIVGINTAFNWTLKDGRIRLARLLAVGEIFAAAPDSVFKVAVAHHHLIPPPNFGSQRVLSNAYEAIDIFSTVGVDLILSGHLHQAYIGNSEEFYPKGRPPVVILHSGTTTSNRGRAGERERNSCNWIAVDGRSMVVSHLRWHSELDRFAEHSRHWYPRQEVTPYTLERLAPPGSAPPIETSPHEVTGPSPKRS
ncbi:MAG TPA: metallophosphoesterase family protein [Thermoanaerobaculia bacterium]|nr:metallophosphoesterase family protein [Thermoanaerobaculia bacterium]